MANGNEVPCAPGKHVPVVVHRTGGPSASKENFCGACGHLICRHEGKWVVDTAKEALSSARKENRGENA